MSPKLKDFLQRWLINAAAVLVASCIIPGIHYQKPLDLVAASLVLGILNAFIRPLLVLLSLPLVIITLGLFMLVINALLLKLAGWLLSPHFHVADFAAAFWGALVITIVTLILNSITGTGGSRVQVHRGPPPSRRRGDDDGPVIDV